MPSAGPSTELARKAPRHRRIVDYTAIVIESDSEEDHTPIPVGRSSGQDQPSV